ncbi:hypothetical protein ACJX0J_017797 [Zea mays]
MFTRAFDCHIPNRLVCINFRYNFSKYYTLGYEYNIKSISHHDVILVVKMATIRIILYDLGNLYFLKKYTSDLGQMILDIMLLVGKVYHGLVKNYDWASGMTIGKQPEIVLHSHTCVIHMYFLCFIPYNHVFNAFIYVAKLSSAHVASLIRVPKITCHAVICKTIYNIELLIAILTATQKKLQITSAEFSISSSILNSILRILMLPLA